VAVNFENSGNSENPDSDNLSNMIKDELTYKIIGCAMKVHNTLGPGFQELIYQRCLAIELERAGLSFAREQKQTIYYEGIDVGTRRADFVVENKVVVEIKAVTALEDVHLAQAKNYVVAYDFSLGLLINFGGKSLEHKLLFNNHQHRT
jgi:GxxExxY protein